MTDIPEDIMRAAEEVVNDYPLIERQALTDIARAILAERERCAQVAENKANKHGWDYHLPSVGREIGAAIRSPERAGE